MIRAVYRGMLASWILLGIGSGMVNAASWSKTLFTENRHDFGPVPRGAKVKHDFVMVNRLEEPITILSLRPSCGCTSGRANASVVGPGQSAVIEAQMDTRNFVGPKSTVLYVSLMTAGGEGGRSRAGRQRPDLERYRAQSGIDRFRDGHARPVADPGPHHRPHQRRGLAVQPDGLGVAGPRRQARRDLARRGYRELQPLGEPEARRPGRPDPRRDPDDEQRPGNAEHPRHGDGLDPRRPDGGALDPGIRTGQFIGRCPGSIHHPRLAPLHDPVHRGRRRRVLHLGSQEGPVKRCTW